MRLASSCIQRLLTLVSPNEALKSKPLGSTARLGLTVGDHRGLETALMGSFTPSHAVADGFNGIWGRSSMTTLALADMIYFK